MIAIAMVHMEIDVGSFRGSDIHLQSPSSVPKRNLDTLGLKEPQRVEYQLFFGSSRKSPQFIVCSNPKRHNRWPTGVTVARLGGNSYRLKEEVVLTE
jgi:hypothetical protein